jgi:ribosomal-protein-serine acetyltransferase
MRPTLADAGILVRPFAADDVGSLYAAVRGSIDTVGRWMS